MRHWISLFLLALVVLSQSACSSGSSPPAPPAPPANGLAPGDELDYKLFPSTIQLDAASLAALATSAPDGTITFHGAPAQIAGLKKGAIVMASAPTAAAPHGFLRYVGDVQSTPDGLTWKTIPVPLSLAFQHLHLKMTRIIGNTGARQFSPTDVSPKDLGGSGGSLTQVVDFYPFDADHDPSTTDDQVHVHGELSAGAMYTLSIDIDWGALVELPLKVAECAGEAFLHFFGIGDGCILSERLPEILPEVIVKFAASADASTKLSIDGVTFSGFSSDYKLGDVMVDPPFFLIGPIPVFIDLSVSAHVEGDASSNFGVGVSGGTHAGVAFSASSKTGAHFEPPFFDPPHFDPPTVDATLAAHAKVSLGPKLALKIFDFAGPQADVQAYVELTANQAQSPCFKVDAGARFDAGILVGLDLDEVLSKLGVGGLGLGSITLIDAKTPEVKVGGTILQGGCALPPPGANTLPPGSGADATHLLTPSFTPWSKTLDGALDAFPHDAESFRFTSVLQSIDGKFVVSGSDVSALTKLDTTGKVVWSKKYVAPSPLPADPNDLLVGRAVPTLDGQLFVTAFPYALMKVGQGGGLYWAEQFPGIARGDDGGPHGNSREENTFTNILEDGAGGSFVIGTHQVPMTSPIVTEALVIHFGPDGAVLWSKSLRIPGERLYPVAISPSDGGSFAISGFDWTGSFSEDGRRAFAARIAADGSVVWAQRMIGCGSDSSLLSVQPATSIRTSGGNTLIAGRLGIYERSFVLVLKPDGSVVSQVAPWTGDALSYMIIQSIKELPTSGFIAAGTYTKGTALSQSFLAGLDAIGTVQWVKRYQINGGVQSESNLASLWLTDDGGVFTAQYTRTPSTGVGSLWVQKPFAKDGSISYAAGAATVDAPPKQTATCPLVLSPVALTVADAALAPVAFAPAVADAALTPSTQAP